MPAPHSAGIVFHRPGSEDSGREFFLGHLGGPLFRRKESGAWSIPKGLIEEGETAWATAQREFHEETSHVLPTVEPIDLGVVRHRSGKFVHGFAIAGDLDPDTAQSNEFEMEWPRGSGRRCSFPELDRFGWFDLDHARPLVPKGQDRLFDRLLTALTTSER